MKSDNKAHHPKNQHPKASELALIILSLAVLLFGVFFLVRTFRDLRRSGFFGPTSYQRLHNRQIGLEGIRGWMTFDYINKSFKMPPEYLKEKLNITDKKYPGITIDRWAKNTKEDSNALIEKIKNLIREFQNTPQVPQAGAV